MPITPGHLDDLLNITISTDALTNLKYVSADLYGNLVIGRIIVDLTATANGAAQPGLAASVTAKITAVNDAENSFTLTTTLNSNNALVSTVVYHIIGANDDSLLITTQTSAGEASFINSNVSFLLSLTALSFSGSVITQGAQEVWGSGYAYGAWQLAKPPKQDGDFDGDGKTDLLWQNDSGQVAVWTMNGTAVTGGAVAGNPGAGWHAIASGDFNKDGKADILWQSATDSRVAVWLMDGTTVLAGSGMVDTNPGPGWTAIGTCEINGDGKSDIIWQRNDGEFGIWSLDGAHVTGSLNLGNPGAGWHLIGTGDFNADKWVDILWQNDSGQAAIWYQQGSTRAGGGLIDNPGASWHALEAADFNGDGWCDILWRSDSNDVAVWLMDGQDRIGGGIIANVSSDWVVKGVGDTNGDGKADIEWQNSNGQAAVWLMDGSSILSAGFAGDNPGAGWHLIAR